MSGAQPFTDRILPAPAAIIEALRQAGVDTVLGIGGGDVVKLFSPMHDVPEIRFVLAREESLAAIMAEVHGRLTGKPAVVIAQGPFMVCNAALGTLEAFCGATPMVLLTDYTDATPWTHHAPYQASTGDWGAFDLKTTLSGFTKQTWVAHDPVQAVQVTQLAVKHAMAGQPGPTAVIFHSHALQGEVGPESIPRLYASGSYLVKDLRPADIDAAAAAADAIATARRPVIVAGGGVRIAQATDELRRVAEALDIPVAVTGAGKSVIAEDHPLALGLIGNFGLDAANAEVGASDVVIAVGTKLNNSDTCSQNPALFDPDRQTLIQIDIEPRNAAWTLPADHVLIGDAGAVLRQLATAVGDRSDRSASGADRVAEAHEVHGSYDVEESFSDAVPITPQRLVHELGEALPADAILTLDAGENRLFINHHHRARSVHGVLQAASIGGMGYAIPAALGAKLSQPDRPAVAFCGDGGFAMGMNGLLTAVEEDLPIIVVVMNNSLLGWVRHVQGDRPVGTELATFDHAEIGRAIGCLGVRVTEPSQLAPALREAAASDRTTVIDVMTTPDATWLDALSSLYAASIGVDHDA